MKFFMLRLYIGIMSLILLLLGWQVEIGDAATRQVSETVAAVSSKKGQLFQSPKRLSGLLQNALRISNQKGIAAARSLLQGRARMAPDDTFLVDVQVRQATSQMLQRLEQEIGPVHRVHRWKGRITVQVSVRLGVLQVLAGLPFVDWVALSSYTMTHPRPAEPRVGSVTSTGDTVMGTAELRSMLGVDGSGVRVGIISDGLVDLQASVNSGDLPASVEIVNGKDGSAEEGNNDEGRAMAEIIHDLAPGATLMFHSGFPTNLDMVAAIEALTAAGANIIVDDLGFLNEPIFEDGPVAQAVQAAIDAGVVYVTATGNSAMENYRALYKELDPDDGLTSINLHDFANGDSTMAVGLPPGGAVFVVLQWADPFDGLANSSDYDLLILDETGANDACSLPGVQGFCVSNDDQLNRLVPPLESVFVQNTSASPVIVNIVINRFEGAVRPVHMLFSGRFEILEHKVSTQSTFGHPCVAEALAVGAIDAADPGFDTIESFSSQGACEIYFPTRETRIKPDVVGADGVNTSVPLFAPFFGTSAAAPHVAAVAALIMEASGGPQALSNIQVNNLLRLSAVDLGDPGFDLIYGHGAVDAVEAGNLLNAGTNTAPESSIASPASDLVIGPGESPDFQGQCVDAENNGPFTFVWDFGGAGAVATVQSPGAMTFATSGVFPVTFTCSDAAGLTDMTPAIRMVTVNQPPISQITSHGDSVIVELGSGLNFTGSCDDADNHVPFTFLWLFGGGATISSSSAQNPSNVVFNTPGDFTVRFTCTDALGITSLNPAIVRVLVNPATTGVAGSSGGSGGGGCTLVPGLARSGWPPIAAAGNILLPFMVLVVMRVWSARRHRR